MSIFVSVISRTCCQTWAVWTESHVATFVGISRVCLILSLSYMAYLWMLTFFAQQQQRANGTLKSRYPILANQIHALLQNDNTLTGTTKVTKGKVDEIEGLGVLYQPAYNPDLVPLGYHIFRAMVHFPRGQKINSVDAVENGCRHSLPLMQPNSITKELSLWYNDGNRQ